MEIYRGTPKSRGPLKAIPPTNFEYFEFHGSSDMKETVLKGGLCGSSGLWVL